MTCRPEPSRGTVLYLAPCQVHYLHDEDPHGPLVLWRPDMGVPPAWIVDPACIVPCGRLGYRRRSGDVFCSQHYQEFCFCACGRETDKPGFCAACRAEEALWT
jgi:hypothetical protein